jgi:Right handed beta helix region
MKNSRIHLYACLLLLWSLLPQAAIEKAHAAILQLPIPVPQNRINVATEPGTDFGEKLRSCIRRLVPDGGTCDALSISGTQTINENPFTGAVGPLRILLGDVTIETLDTWGLPGNLDLSGKGKSTVLRLAPGANKDLIRNAAGIRGNRRIWLHDLTLDGNSANQTAPVSALHFTSVIEFIIERVTVLNSAGHGIALDDGCMRGKLFKNRIEGVKLGAAIRAGNTPVGSVSYIEIRENEISKAAEGDGILVVGGMSGGLHTLNVDVVGNTVTAVKGASIHVGDGSQKVMVTGNRIELRGAPGGSSGSVGIVIRSAQEVQVANNTISGDTAEHEQVGLRAWSPAKDKGGALSQVAIENNTVSDVAGNGIQVESGGVRLIKNTIRRSAKKNIYVAENVTDVTQQGNKME